MSVNGNSSNDFVYSYNNFGQHSQWNGRMFAFKFQNDIHIRIGKKNFINISHVVSQTDYLEIIMRWMKDITFWFTVVISYFMFVSFYFEGSKLPFVPMHGCVIHSINVS